MFVVAGFIFLTLLDCHESDVTALFASAKQHLQAKRYDDATAILDRLRHCDNLSPLESFEMGWLYGRARCFAESLSIFKTVPVNVPDRASHEYAIALSNFELADYRSTVETLKTLAKEEALSAESANLLAVSYSKLGLYGQAESTLSQEIEHNRGDLTAYLNLVTLYADQDRFAEAEKIASKAVKGFTKSSEVFLVRGAANTLIGKLDKAYDDFSMAASLAPHKADPRFFLALTSYKQGKFVEAANSLQSANRLGIADSDLHYLRAECLLKVNGANTQPAIAELDRAIEMNTNSVSARALRGKLLLEAGRTKEAVADLERAHQQDPNSRSAAYNLARAYRTLGLTDESRLLFEQFRNQKADSLSELTQRRLNQVLTRRELQP
jgi:tetratricopeptide (TPR) repeat protein